MMRWKNLLLLLCVSACASDKWHAGQERQEQRQALSIVTDTFDTDLTGWSFWTNAPGGTSYTYALTFRGDDGAPAGSAQTAGDYVATTPYDFGMTKTFAIGATSSDVLLRVDYRAQASSSSETNGTLQVKDADTNVLIVQQSLLDAQATDTGWRSRLVRLPAALFVASRNLRIILSLKDSSLTNSSQSLRIDNVTLSTALRKDTFDYDVSAWSFWTDLPSGTHTYALTFRGDDGLPAGSSQVAGNYAAGGTGYRFGSSKVFDVPTGATMVLSYDYRAKSTTTTNTNGSVRVLNADTGAQLFDQSLFTDHPTDTGWRSSAIQLSPAQLGSATHARVVFYLLDATSQNRSNTIQVDNVSFARTGVTEDPPLWKFTSPVGMTQQPGYDEYNKDGLRFRLYGWKFGAEVSDLVNTITVTPRKSGAPPMDVSLGAAISLMWTITPMSLVYGNNIQWAPGVKDTGFLTYHVLETGIFNSTYVNVPANVTIDLAGTAAPTVLVPGSLYQLGAVRIRIVEGAPVLAGNTITLGPSAAGRIQFLLYARSAVDTQTVDVMGANTTSTPDEIVTTDGFKIEKSLRLRFSQLGYDQYLAINPATPSPNGLLVDQTAFFLADATGVASGWRLGKSNLSILKTGALTFRNFVYSYAPISSTQTFNYYLSTSRGTQTFWSAGRVTQPYSVSYHPATGVHMFSFPETEVDGAEPSFMLRTLRNQTVFAFHNASKTLMTAEVIRNTVNITHTGTGGNSIDGGFRHILLGVTGDVRATKTRNGTWTDRPQAPSQPAQYAYVTGNAGYIVGSKTRYIVRKRLWKGVWETATDFLPTLANTSANVNILGFMKNVVGTTAANSTATINHVVQLDGRGVIPDKNEAEDTYRQVEFLPSANVAGMIDLADPNARTAAPWDLGVLSGIPRVVYPQ